MNIEVKALPEAQRGSCPAEYSFGTGFSDHMFTQAYEVGQGWHDAEIKPFENLSCTLLRRCCITARKSSRA